jgi:hypothetical protein
MAFLPNDYEPVDSRVHKFWETFPNGRIHTEIVLINETEIVIKASVFTDRDDPRPASIDFAQETRNSSPVNKHSFVENCSTSAIGRALATLGYSTKGKRPSREEMQKVERVASLHVVRDWDLELVALAETRDVDGLRELRKDAIRSLQPKEFIAKLDAAGKALSDTPETKEPAGTQKPTGSGVE